MSYLRFIRFISIVIWQYLGGLIHRSGMPLAVYTNECRKYIMFYRVSKNKDLVAKRIRAFCSSQINLVHDRLVLDDDVYAPVIVVVVKDDLERMKLFYEHYRNLGVRKFVVIDNNSTDGTREFVMGQPDTREYLVTESFQTQKKEAWIDKVLALTGYNRWYVVVDSDELLDYVGSEQLRIDDFIRQNTANGAIRLQGYLVDMYSKAPLFSEQCEYQDIPKVFSMFDVDSYQEPRPNQIYGGPRNRLFGLDDLLLSKQSIFFFVSKMLYRDCHYMYVPKMKQCEDMTFVLRHYKYLATDKPIYENRVKEQCYYNNSIEYRQIMEDLEKHPLASFATAKSVMYQSSESLRVLPFVHWPKPISHDSLPSVCIIIPLFNSGGHIVHCLESVAAQTYQGTMECIIVDDCGTDGSISLAEDFIKSYKGQVRFRIVHHAENMGLSEARNTGIREATCDYIYFLDSDDTIIPKCIEMMVGCLKKYPDAQIVFAGAETSNGMFKWLDYTKKQLPEYSNDHEWLQRSMLKRYDFGMTAWNRLISRSFIQKNKLSFVRGLVHEDEVWNFDLAKYIQSAAFVKKNTYKYNLHDNSITVGASDNLQWERRFALWDVLLSKLDEENKEIQIRAICTQIMVETRKKFPVNHRKSLCKLFLTISKQSQGILTLWLIVQGLLAITPPFIYRNKFTCSRICL